MTDSDWYPRRGEDSMSDTGVPREDGTVQPTLTGVPCEEETARLTLPGVCGGGDNAAYTAL